MKKLSIIIVNYNVCYFLEQTLISVKKALSRIDGDVWIVDNNSADNSVEMVKEKFPEFNLIENKVNYGFSKANNQAIRQTNSEYVLLLNPDTVVEENTFEKCISFLDSHPDAGGLGVKMLDGRGNFLPESKRGFPTPWIAFYKMFGLSFLFPKSKKFGKYHLTYLDKDKIHEVEVLSGAFMIVRKSVLDKIGLLDEDYFMYGEDIDLSYRILKSGYKNYYYPETRIIHYKGESTKKTSINYVFIFYKAMIIFAQKHFPDSKAGAFSFLIKIAIYLRAFLSISSRFIQKCSLPFADASLIYAGMYLLKTYWENNHKYVRMPYPPVYMEIIVPIYIGIWLMSIYFFGGYRTFFQPRKIIQGALTGTLIISAVSNFFDDYRFSKALIVLGGILTIACCFLIRMIVNFIRSKKFFTDNSNKKVLIAGLEEECLRVIRTLNAQDYNLEILGFVSQEKSTHKDYWLGKIDRLKEICLLYKPDEIIFCSKGLDTSQIIEWMLAHGEDIPEYKIVPDESNFVIGSNSSNTPGSFYTLDIKLNKTDDEKAKTKRLFDVLIAFFFLLSFPVLMFLVKKPGKFLKNIFKVISGKVSWVGLKNSNTDIQQVKSGIIDPIQGVSSESLDEETVKRLNYLYSRDYTPINDIQLIFRSLRNLGA